MAEPGSASPLLADLGALLDLIGERGVPLTDTGCHEIRLRVWKNLHRVFVRLDGERRRLVLLDGETKRVDALLPEAVYRRVGRYRDDYLAKRRVSPAR